MKNVIKTTRRIVGDICVVVGGVLVMAGTAIGRDDTFFDLMKVVDPAYKALGLTAKLAASDGETIEIGA